jgi:hypothetical protein
MSVSAEGIDFRAPPFDQLADLGPLLALPDEDFLTAVNARLQAPRLVSALACNDGLHYEQRVAQQGVVSTRPDSWHDRFGALAWLQFPATKRALNELQMEGIAAIGTKQRTRHQQALTHVDEAGMIVASSDPGWIDDLFEHRFAALLTARRAQFGVACEVQVLGHALFELRLTRSDELLAGKVLPVIVDRSYFAQPTATRRALLDRRIAQALRERELAADPKDLATLPLAALPGWHPRNADPDFIAHAPCFRPKPPGRYYAPAVML